MSFDAGSIDSTMTLDRRPFAQGLRQARRLLRRFSQERATAKVDVDTARAHQRIRTLRAQLRNLNALGRHVDVGANTAGASEALRRLQAQTQAFSRSGGRAQVGVDTTASAARLRVLQRQIAGVGASHATARVSVAGAVAASAATQQVQRMIDQLGRSRARPHVDKGSIDDAGDEVGRLQRALMLVGAWRARPTIRLRVRGVASAIAKLTALEATTKGLTGPLRMLLILGGATAVLGALSQIGSGLMAVVRGVATASGALVTLPAIIAAVVAGAMVLTKVFDGFGEALSEDAETAEKALAALPQPAADAARALRGLRGSFDGVQEGMQAAFFAGLAPRLALLGDALLPAVGRGAVQVAAGLNSAAHSVTEFAVAGQTARDVETTLNNTAHAFSILGPAAGFFLTALRDITAVGSEYLPSMARHITTSAERFADFIANARSAGDINRWIEDGVAAWRDLRAITGSTWRTIAAIFDGLRGTDAPTTLGEVRDAMAGLERIVTGDAFQEGLRSFADIFRANMARAAELTDTVRDAFDLLRPALETFLSGSGQYFATWLATVTSVLAVLSPLLYGIAWVFELLSPVLGVVGGALSLMGTYLLIARVAMVAFNSALAIMNTLMNLNPIGLVVIALIAIAAAVWYAWNNFDWFRNGVLALWEVLSTGAMKLWNDYLSPVVDWIVAAWVNYLWPALQFVFDLMVGYYRFLGSVVMWLWTNVVSPVVDWIVAAWVNYLWPALQFVYDLMIGYYQFLGSVVMWLWTNVVSPVVDWIVAAWVNHLWPAIQFVADLWVSNITAMWNVVKALWDFIWPIIEFIALVGFALIVTYLGILWAFWKTVFTALGAAAMWLWTNVVSPVVTWIVDIWNTYLVPSLLWLRDRWNDVMNILGAALTWLWTNVVSPVIAWMVARWLWLHAQYDRVRILLSAAFNVLGVAVGTLRDRFKSAIDRIVTFGQNLLKSFRGVRDSIKEIFRSIANYARTPINWVIGTVYNDGIRKISRSVLNAVGMSKLADKIPLASTIPAFNQGGPVVDPSGFVRGAGSATSDSIYARIANREFVVNARATERWRPVLEWINNQGRRSTSRTLTAPSQGGPADLPGFNQGGAVSSALSIAKGAFLGGAKGALEEAMEALGWNGWIRDLKSGPPVWEGAAGGAMGMVGTGFLDLLAKEDKKGGGMGVVNQAKKHVGKSGNPNEFTRAFGMDGLAWCAMFVSEMIRAAKAEKMYHNVRSAAVMDFAAAPFKRVPQGSAQPGDLAGYRSGSGPGGWSHINIVENPKNRTAIGGNESNAVRRSTGYYSRASQIWRPGLAQGGLADWGHLRAVLGQDYRDNSGRTTPDDLAFYRVLAGLPAYAEGGDAEGISLVGEDGPEIAEFGAKARVRPASETAEVLAEAIIRALRAMGVDPASASASEYERASVVVNGLATPEVIEEIVRRLRAEEDLALASAGSGMAPKPRG